MIYYHFCYILEATEQSWYDVGNNYTRMQGVGLIGSHLVGWLPQLHTAYFEKTSLLQFLYMLETSNPTIKKKITFDTTTDLIRKVWGLSWQSSGKDRASTAGVVGAFPGWKLKIPHALQGAPPKKSLEVPGSWQDKYDKYKYSKVVCCLVTKLCPTVCDSTDMIKFYNNELMVWATVRSRSSFCQLYRASPVPTAKNIINLISVLTIWWCPHIVVSCAVGKGCVLWPVCSLEKTVSLCPASFCTPRPNLAVSPAISCLNSWILFLATLSIVFLDVEQAPFLHFQNVHQTQAWIISRCVSSSK